MKNNCFSFRKTNNVSNEQSSTSGEPEFHTENDDVQEIGFLTQSEASSQRKRQHSNSIHAIEENEMFNDKIGPKRCKAKSEAEMHIERELSIAKKILEFKHVGFALCDIASFSSKWKYDRENAIIRLKTMGLLERISNGVKKSTSRPFDYHIKLPPRNPENFDELKKFNDKLKIFQLDFHAIRSTYSSINLGELIGLSTLKDKLSGMTYLIGYCPVSD